MVEFKDAIINTVLISVFIVALIAFGTQIAIDNNANHTILEKSSINKIYGTLNETIIGGAKNSTAAHTNLGQDVPTEGSDLSLLAIPRIAVSLPKILFNVFDAIGDMLEESIGLPKIALYALTTIIVVIIIAVGISLIRAGK